MTKSDWVWVAIRIFGIYLVVMAICTVPPLISSLVNVSAYWGWKDYEDFSNYDDKDNSSSSLSNATAAMWRNIFWSSASTLIGAAVRIALLGGIGIYFLRKGTLIYRLVFPGEEGEKPTPDSTEEKP